jgi:GNAT superfamily N-acetyltransferase
MSWWKSQPVFAKSDTPLWGTIASVPRFESHPQYTIYRLNPEYIDAVLEFINRNYLYGYALYKDYLQRKIDFPGALALVLMDANKIIGFIYSCPITLNTNHECAYVDLMTVHKSYRNQGLAKVLISAITNFSNLRHYIHKKDKDQLPFPYFYKTRHYSGHVPTLFQKYYNSRGCAMHETSSSNLQAAMSLYDEWLNSQAEFKPIVSCDTFKSSDSVKTFFNNDEIGGFMFSFSIFEFQMGFLKKSKIAEIFFINTMKFNLHYYVSMIRCLHALSIEYAVIQNNAFFAEIIKIDNYFESMDLFLHSYNLNIPKPCQYIQLPVL